MFYGTYMQISNLHPCEDQLIYPFVFAQLNSAEVGAVEGVVVKS